MSPTLEDELLTTLDHQGSPWVKIINPRNSLLSHEGLRSPEKYFVFSLSYFLTNLLKKPGFQRKRSILEQSVRAEHNKALGIGSSTHPVLPPSWGSTVVAIGPLGGTDVDSSVPWEVS